MTGIIYDIREDENYVLIKDNEKVVGYLFSRFGNKTSIINNGIKTANRTIPVISLFFIVCSP